MIKSISMKKTIALLFILINLYSFSQVIKPTSTLLTDGSKLKVENTDYFITPPSGYNYIPEHMGFMNTSKQTSITVTPHDTTSYYLMISSLLNSDYSVVNAELISKEEIKNRNGFLFTFLFTVQGKPVERMIYVSGNSENCVVVNCNYKQIDKEKYLPELKKSAFTITR